MKLHILMGQRKCSYPGEYAPEALAVHDDNARSDNPDYLDQELEKYQVSEEFDGLAIIQVDIDGSKVAAILNPTHAPLKGTVSVE